MSWENTIDILTSNIDCVWIQYIVQLTFFNPRSAQ